MNSRTERRLVPGPAGAENPLELAIDQPEGSPRGLVLVCHPHPLHGGTLDNKVVQTLVRAALHCGHTAVRFNFRGVGRSAGTWDEGRGELEDARAVLAAVHGDGQPPGFPLILAGFSFGAAIAARRRHGSRPGSLSRRCCWWARRCRTSPCRRCRRAAWWCTAKTTTWCR